MTNQYIKTAKVARENIGKMVFYDDIGPRYIMLRSGTLQEVDGRNVKIDGNWYWMSHLKGFRNFENGGAWERNK